ncbi:MAG: hypothetical protein AB1762_02570 [Gemmatimonadota bacterium]
MAFPLRTRTLALALGALALGACSSSPPQTAAAPQPDPRVGLRAGKHDAAEAVSNLRVLSKNPPPERHANATNSDIAFTGNYAIQGNYYGPLIWDISNPSKPTLKAAIVCPASQNDVSVYRNLLFVSAEAFNGRLDCGTTAFTAADSVSKQRMRGIRIFDISDMANPKLIHSVQTCRGSHTHTVLEDPKDKENVYIYVSGSAPVRSPNEMPGCIDKGAAQNDPDNARFRIEVIKVPLANPAAAAIVASPRIFNDLVAPPRHGEAPEDIAAAKARADSAIKAGGYVVNVFGNQQVLPNQMIRPMLDSLVKVRGGTGAPTAADSAKLRTEIQGIVDKLIGAQPQQGSGPRPGPTQCHDITVYPALGLAGGACEGYGFLLDISDPVNPRRIGAVADSNFAYWHSATFNNDGTKILFSDEWGGGGGPKCRATDKKEWGANAIFTVENRQMKFKSYYKMPAAQTSLENCVAHNGSLIPIPGRDVMVQSWYQGGISIFDFTDPANPKEIAFHDRGPTDSVRAAGGGSWSVYWYNGAMYSSEIARGFDVFELTPSEHLTQNEIDAAKTVHFDYFNAQGQPKLVWPPSFALARAYTDQLERNKCLSAERIASVRQGLAAAERASGTARSTALSQMTTQLESDARSSCDGPKVQKLVSSIRDLSNVLP